MAKQKPQTNTEETKLALFIAKHVIAMRDWAVVIVDGVNHFIRDIAFGELHDRVRAFIRQHKLEEVLSA